MGTSKGQTTIPDPEAMPGRAQHRQHGAPCSPQDVLGMAHFYAIDIDQKQEYWLLAIALEARLAPVEEPYVEEVQTDGRLLYVDKRWETPQSP